MMDHLHFIYLFAINTKTITSNKYHIIVAKFVKIIVVIKMDEWTTRNIHCTVHVLYYLYKPGGPK